MVFFNKHSRKFSYLGSVLFLMGSMTACNHKYFASDADAEFKPVATVQEIMNSIIDPNIDFVWNSVSSVSTAKGTEERKPETAEDWNVLRQHALTVVEAANLLLVENRPVAIASAATSSGGAELNSDAIKALIATNRTAYVNRIHELQVAAQGLIVAIDAKNVQGLEDAGGKVEQACEQCHSQFWYPGDNKPK